VGARTNRGSVPADVFRRSGTPPLTPPRPDPVAAFERRRGEALRRSRRQALAFGAVFLAAFLLSCVVGEVDPHAFLDGLPNLFSYVHDILPRIRPDRPLADIAHWYRHLDRWLLLLWDTVLIGFLGTLIGGTTAFLLCFPASHGLMPRRSIRFVTRRILEIARSVPELVYAMIFVFAFGLGPLPGVLAIAVHTAGALGKLYSEVNEAVDPRQIEGVRAAGGNWFQVIRYGVVPQVLPGFASYTVLRFEISVREATVVGFVGAGGIGQELMFVFRQFLFADISAIVLMIILLVCAIDISCEQVRRHLIGREASP